MLTSAIYGSILNLIATDNCKYNLIHNFIFYSFMHVIKPLSDKKIQSSLMSY